MVWQLVCADNADLRTDWRVLMLQGCSSYPYAHLIPPPATSAAAAHSGNRQHPRGDARAVCELEQRSSTSPVAAAAVGDGNAGGGSGTMAALTLSATPGMAVYY